MRTAPLLAALAAPLLFQAAVSAQFTDPRTPIDIAHTPGDTNSVFRIDQPGSYYLSGPLRGKPGKVGLEIAASHVTIDLMGFPVSGVPGSLDGIGISVGKMRTDITIENGSVYGWGESGVDLASADHVRLRDVRASNNGNHGIEIGSYGSVHDCSASNNGASGMLAADTATFVDCVSTGNLYAGIDAGVASMAERSMAHDNEVGFNISNGYTHRSSAYENNGMAYYSRGISKSFALNNGAGMNSNRGVVEGSISEGAAAPSAGFSGRGLFEGNAAVDNHKGFHLSSGPAVARGNYAYDNSFSGIQVDDDCVVEGNLAMQNGYGVRVEGRSVVRDNVAQKSSGQDYAFIYISALRGPLQPYDNAPELILHPGVNVAD